jgi:hypothetical protein
VRSATHGDDLNHDNDDAPSTSYSISKSSRVRNLARRTKQKTKDILNREKAPDSEPGSDSEQGDLFSDPAAQLWGPQFWRSISV